MFFKSNYKTDQYCTSFTYQAVHQVQRIFFYNVEAAKWLVLFHLNGHYRHKIYSCSIQYFLLIEGCTLLQYFNLLIHCIWKLVGFIIATV